MAEYDVNNLIVVGVVKIDEHSRLTFTKRIKNVFPVHPGNTIVIYQDTTNNNLLFKVQRENQVSDIWIVKKRNENIKSFYDFNSKEKSKVIEVELNKEDNKDKHQLQQHLQPPSSSPKQTKSIVNIMIIDDEKDKLEMFQSMLHAYYDQDKQQKYTVNAFVSSKDAIKQFLDANCSGINNTAAYDLVIIGIKIPNINGIQLYQVFRILDLNIQFLFISGIDIADELLGLLPGIKPYQILRKPFSAEEFISKVKEIIHYGI